MDRKKWLMSLWTAESRDGGETSCSLWLLAVIMGQGQQSCSHVSALAGCKDSGEHLERFLMYLRFGQLIMWRTDKKGSLPLLATLTNAGKFYLKPFPKPGDISLWGTPKAVSLHWSKLVVCFLSQENLPQSFGCQGNAKQTRLWLPEQKECSPSLSGENK